jgi:tRNA threonylcarbamoyladenosine biosynthesis protein TsaB
MALILSIETGTDICSVALANNGELMALRESDEGRDHAKKVAVFVDELLRETGVQPSDLDAIAVGKGPGSYTGLRIGVSFAKGLCYALDIPLIAIGSLDALAEVAREDYDAGIVDLEDEQWGSAMLCPMVDARRMEVYAAVLNSEGVAQSDVVAEVVTEESFREWRNAGHFVIFGNGAAKCAEVLPDATFISVAPSARGIVRLAEEAFNEGRFEDLAYFEPFYLKDFIVIPSKKKLL